MNRRIVLLLVLLTGALLAIQSCAKQGPTRERITSVLTVKNPDGSDSLYALGIRGTIFRGDGNSWVRHGSIYGDTAPHWMIDQPICITQVSGSMPGLRVITGIGEVFASQDVGRTWIKLPIIPLPD